MERRSIVLPLTPGPSPARGEGEYVSCSPDGLGNRKKAENRLCFAKEAPMKIQLALLALALVATDVRAEETVWIEAEHLQGVQGYCWPAGPNPKTDGHWGISGPGWAAEWTQGGESNFHVDRLRARRRQGHRRDRCRDAGGRQLFRLGPLPRQSRLPPAGSRFGSRHRLGSRSCLPTAPSDHRRRQRDEALLELGLRLGRARGERCPRANAELDLLSAFKEKECRQIDCIVLTTDKKYRPLIKERPAHPTVGSS